MSAEILIFIALGMLITHCSIHLSAWLVKWNFRRRINNEIKDRQYVFDKHLYIDAEDYIDDWGAYCKYDWDRPGMKKHAGDMTCFKFTIKYRFKKYNICLFKINTPGIYQYKWISMYKNPTKHAWGADDVHELIERTCKLINHNYEGMKTVNYIEGPGFIEKLVYGNIQKSNSLVPEVIET